MHNGIKVVSKLRRFFAKIWVDVHEFLIFIIYIIYARKHQHWELYEEDGSSPRNQRQQRVLWLVGSFNSIGRWVMRQMISSFWEVLKTKVVLPLVNHHQPKFSLHAKEKSYCFITYVFLWKLSFQVFSGRCRRFSGQD